MTEALTQPNVTDRLLYEDFWSFSAAKALHLSMQHIACMLVLLLHKHASQLLPSVLVPLNRIGLSLWQQLSVFLNSTQWGTGSLGRSLARLSEYSVEGLEIRLEEVCQTKQSALCQVSAVSWANSEGLSLISSPLKLVDRFPCNYISSNCNHKLYWN